MTRLNGTPIQTFAMITEVRAHSGEVSQSTGPMPTACRTALTTPESLFSIQDQVDAETISGSSHGMRNSARSVADSRNPRAKNTASAMPIVYWKAKLTVVNTTVCHSAGANVGSSTTVRKFSRPENG